MGQLSEILTGVGQISEPSEALSGILYSRKRIGFMPESNVEEAVVALARLTAAVEIDSERPEPLNKSLAGEFRHPKPPRRLMCSVCHLGLTMSYCPEEDYRYLVNHDGRLLPIEDVRLGREGDHYRVILHGDKTPIPVQAIAKAFVSTESHLTGMTIEEVLQQ